MVSSGRKKKKKAWSLWNLEGTAKTLPEHECNAPDHRHPQTRPPLPFRAENISKRLPDSSDPTVM